MKNIAKILIPLVLIFSVYYLNGKEVDKSRAQLVAKNFLFERSIALHEKIIITSDYAEYKNGLTLYYVFNSHNGFIIISACDAVYPVLGYSFEGQFIANDLPPALEFWLKHYQDQIEFSILNDMQPKSDILKIWKKYESGDVLKFEKNEFVEPLLYTTWSQGCNYNGQFPADTNGPCGYLWTGCVATAMGQIMKYYNYPKNGIGSNSYYTSYGVQEADFGSTYYNWTEMNYHLTSNNDPVAELLYHSAVSVNSIFTSGGTGAYDFDARDALVDFFGYKDEAAFYWRTGYSGNWSSMLRYELDMMRPVLYGGVDLSAQTGHTFVCDGYQDTTHFHFNWGWDGYYDGYYYIDSLAAGGSYFNFQHDAIVGIQPNINGIIELYPPENLIAEVEDHAVTLTWDVPSPSSTLELLGYNIFRNDTLINEKIISELSYTDGMTPVGSHEYKVRSVFIGDANGPYASTEAYISDISPKEVLPFNIYPNPITDHLFINFYEHQEQDIKLEILDLTGRMVHEIYISNSESNPIKIDIDLPSGFYLLEVNSDHFLSSQKILVK